MVREARLELAHLAAPEPKSGASTNFATPATTFEKKRLVQRVSLSKYGWGTWIRTRACQDQNLVPYRLAIPQNGGYDGIRTCDPNIMSVVL